MASRIAAIQSGLRGGGLSAEHFEIFARHTAVASVQAGYEFERHRPAAGGENDWDFPLIVALDNMAAVAVQEGDGAPLGPPAVKAAIPPPSSPPSRVYGFDRSTPELMRRVTRRLSEALAAHAGDAVIDR